ncbi:MAG: hypothetical protein FJ152_07360 [Firmicutes bacterium]|nr:hypothetical protein [Bacillota bacterium]
MTNKTDNKSIYQGRGSDFMIRINNDDPAVFKGKIEHIKTGQIQYFNDFLEMIMLVQSKLDDQNYPQSDTELRSFS